MRAEPYSRNSSPGALWARVPTNESRSGTSAQVLETASPARLAPSETVLRFMRSWVPMSSTPDRAPPYFVENPPLEKKALSTM